jgi:nitrate reductase gamma subunit
MISGAFFVALPYMALIVFFGGTIYRYRHSGFTYSSISSQFLEGKKIVLGYIAFSYWHFGYVIWAFYSIFIPKNSSCLEFCAS